MNPTRRTTFLTALAAVGLCLPSAHAALTTGLAYSAFNISGNPDPSGYTTVPSGAVPFVSTDWANVTNTHGAYISDFGTDIPQTGPGAVWNRVGATAQQDGNAQNVTLLYRGWFYDSDGLFTFAENIDDNVQVKIDGTVVLLNDQGLNDGGNQWQSVTTSTSDLTATGSTVGGNTAWAGLTPSQQMGAFDLGWHSIEIRLGEFSGTGGPHDMALLGASGANWNSTFGFGIAGIGDGPIPFGADQYNGAMYQAFDAANFPLAPDGGPGLRYDDIDPTGGTNIIIPEPAALALLFGGLSLGALGRRRRA
jgi:hypothetical protein